MTVEVRYCPQCGTRRTGYFRFCGRCGFDFDELRIGPAPETTEPVASPRPEPTTPIWPPPVQWPPPDAAPSPPMHEPAPEPATWPQQPAPVPATWPQQPAPATPSRIVDAEAASRVDVQADRPILAESLTPPQLRSAAPVSVPVPEEPVVSRRRAVTWTRLAIVVLAALLAVNAISRAMTASPNATVSPTAVVGSPLIGGSLSAPSAAASSVASPDAALTPGPSFGPPAGTQFAVVTKVVDGDTIRVDIDGTEYPVRYIGIDAPEPDATDPTMKRLADAATATNAALVEGQDVYLEREVSDKDQFDRLLRNVWIVDSGGSQVLVNLELVRLGFATVTTIPPDQKYAGYLTTAQAAAKSEARNLWAP